MARFSAVEAAAGDRLLYWEKIQALKDGNGCEGLPIKLDVKQYPCWIDANCRDCSLGA